MTEPIHKTAEQKRCEEDAERMRKALEGNRDYGRKYDMPEGFEALFGKFRNKGGQDASR